MTDIVQNQSLSFDAIKADLFNYVQSLNSNDSGIKGFYEGGAGVTLIEMMAGIAAYLNLIALKSRREAYIDEAKLTSSVVNIATTLGYDTNRKAAPLYNIDVFCINPVTQTKEVIIGYYNSIPLSLLEDTTLQVGDNSLTVAMGIWKSFNVTSTSSSAYTRFLVQDEVDNNLYQLLINGELVPTVRAAELLDNTNVLLRTYFAGTYIIFGDGIFGRSLNVGDQIEFDYLTPTAISSDAVLVTAAATSNIGQITSGTVITYGSDQDSNAKLAVVAPGYYTAKRRLVTYSDYRYLALSYNGVVSSAVQKHPGICCTVDLAVIMAGGRNPTTGEQQGLLSYLDDFQVLGTNINLVPATAITVSVKMIVVVQTTADQTAIGTIINNYLNTMTLNLGQFFSISGLLNLALPGVIGIYPQYPIIDNQAAYNEFFVISDVTIQYTTTVSGIKQFGADTTLGYS